MAVAQTGTGLAVDRPGAIVPAVAGGDSTRLAITISARNLDFGAVPVGSNNELSFRIQNVGADSLTGTAEVSPPFSIVEGSAFVLKPAQTQLIRVQYAPKSMGMHMTVVHLTGTSVTVMGCTAPHVPKVPARRRRAPAQSDGQRLLASK
jgi:hypothetical protein